jgi:hypothetical protein
MDSQWTSNLENQPCDVTQGTVGSGSCYIEAAPLIDVLFEQLGYLLTHSSETCSAGCVDCARLDHVRRWLLSPFHEPDVYDSIIS